MKQDENTIFETMTYMHRFLGHTINGLDSRRGRWGADRGVNFGMNIAIRKKRTMYRNGLLTQVCSFTRLGCQCSAGMAGHE